MTDDSGFLDHDPLDDLLNRVDSLVEGWRPEAGSKIAGTVVDIDEGTSDWGPYPLVTLEVIDDEGTSTKEVGIHCFHFALRNQVERKIKAGVLEIGCEMAVKYFGLGENAKKGQGPPNLYRVAIRPVKR